MPTYNRSSTLRQTLDSIAGQIDLPAEAIEVVASNDASSDDTQAVLDEYAERMPYLRVFHQPMNLNTQNWKFALDQARGEFVFVLCDDDAIVPDFVITYLRAFENDPELDMVIGDIELRDPQFRFLTSMPLNETPQGFADGETRCRIQLMSHHMVMGTMYRRRVLLDAGGWDPQVGTHFDCTAYCRAALRARKTLRVARPMLYFRLSQGSWSHQVSTKNQAQLARWYRRKLDLLADDAATFAPTLLPDLRDLTRSHVRIVTFYLETELAHGRLSGRAVRAALHGLLESFPEQRNDSQVWKVYLCSYMGIGWLKALRKLRGRPDPYSSPLSLFNSFIDPAVTGSGSTESPGSG